MYKSRHFDIREYVPPEIYNARGERAWELLDERMLRTDDLLRDRYGAIIINNWHTPGGTRHWSGIRTPASPQFSPTSQHTFGRASDKIFAHTTAEAVRRDILANPDDETFKLIMAVEMGVDWLHTDFRNCDRIKAFKA